jgi:hypothetical protein
MVSLSFSREGTAILILYIDLSVTKWETIDAKTQRILKYWMPVSNPIGNITVVCLIFKLYINLLHDSANERSRSSRNSSFDQERRLHVRISVHRNNTLY